MAGITIGRRGSSRRPSHPPTEPIPSSPLLRSPQDAHTWNDCIKLHRVRTVAVRYILAARSITPLRLRNLIGLAAGMIDQDEWEVHLQRCPLRPASQPSPSPIDLSPAAIRWAACSSAPSHSVPDAGFAPCSLPLSTCCNLMGPLRSRPPTHVCAHRLIPSGSQLRPGAAHHARDLRLHARVNGIEVDRPHLHGRRIQHAA